MNDYAVMKRSNPFPSYSIVLSRLKILCVDEQRPEVLALILTKTRLSENHEKKLKRAFVGNDANNVLVLQGSFSM